MEKLHDTTLYAGHMHAGCKVWELANGRLHEAAGLARRERDPGFLGPGEVDPVLAMDFYPVALLLHVVTCLHR